jgi:ParB family chromosome partitioning protein
MSLKDLQKKSAAAMEQSNAPGAGVGSTSESSKRAITSPGATAMMKPTIDALSERAKMAESRVAALEVRIKDLESSAIAISDIEPNPWQPRRVFNEEEIQALAESVAETGLIQPVVVRRKSVSNRDTFQLIAGERRLRAHRLLGLAEIKAVVLDVSDESMATMALAENIARQDLTAYEISLAIRAAQQQFKSTKRLAESIGVGRTDLYRYLAFADLPDFIRSDLDESPGLLGRDAASLLVSILKKHGQPAIDALLKLWPRVKSGDLDQGKIASLVEATVTRGEPLKTDRDIKKLFVGKEQAGSMTRDGSGFTIKIKAAALTAEKETELRSFVERMFGGTA